MHVCCFVHSFEHRLISRGALCEPRLCLRIDAYRCFPAQSFKTYNSNIVLSVLASKTKNTIADCNVFAHPFDYRMLVLLMPATETWHVVRK